MNKKLPDNLFIKYNFLFTIMWLTVKKYSGIVPSMHKVNSLLITIIIITTTRIRMVVAG